MPTRSADYLISGGVFLFISVHTSMTPCWLFLHPLTHVDTNSQYTQTITCDLNGCHDQIKAENPDMKTTEISKVLGEKWREMDDNAKSPFQLKANADKERCVPEPHHYSARVSEKSSMQAIWTGHCCGPCRCVCSFLAKGTC